MREWIWAKHLHYLFLNLPNPKQMFIFLTTLEKLVKLTFPTKPIEAKILRYMLRAPRGQNLQRFYLNPAASYWRTPQHNHLDSNLLSGCYIKSIPSFKSTTNTSRLLNVLWMLHIWFMLWNIHEPTKLTKTWGTRCQQLIKLTIWKFFLLRYKGFQKSRIISGCTFLAGCIHCCEGVCILP